MIQIRTVASSIVLRQRRFPHVETVCFQTRHLLTDRKQVYENVIKLYFGR